jgi:hypothetical protein
MPQQMNDRQQAVRDMCERAIAALESPDNNTFSEAMTHKLIAELQNMVTSLDPEIFSPTFGRAIVDSFDGPLAEQLLNASYQYSRIRKKGRLRHGRPNEYGG